MNVKDFLRELDAAQAVGEGWMARCPAHDDQTPSLSVRSGKDGRVLVYCHAGCTVEEVVAAVGLELRDLMGDVVTPPGSPATLQPQAKGCTVAQYSKAKELPLDFLTKLGVTDYSHGGTPAVRIPYRDAAGAEVAVRFRTALSDEDGSNRFRWRTHDRPTLYGLDHLSEAKELGVVFIVEGESDAQALWLNDIPAVGVPGANCWREAEYAPLFDGIETILVVVENDQGGAATLQWLSKSAIRDRSKVVRLDPLKDVSELYLDDPARFVNRLVKAADDAPHWTEVADAEKEKARKEAWTKCSTLAASPSILDRLTEELRQMGVVGEDRAAKLLFLVLATRHFQRPVNSVVKGPSSAGKSFVTESVLRFFPPDAYYTRTAMSPRALAYSQEPMQHRFLVLFEAAGMKDSTGDYLLRSLLSEGRIEYETVEKTKDGMRSRVISREGPTGLIVTTTAVSLHRENETRLISIPATDTRKQTKRILRAMARGSSSAYQPDFLPWHALDRWLSSGPTRVIVPFALALASEVPAVAVRLRRDFRTVITLVEAHALLHQVSRRRRNDGSIIAKLDDYEAVRGLVSDLIASGVEATIPATVRETVAAVNDGASTVAEVAAELKLDKSAAWRRVAVAERSGFLENLETRKGRQAQLVVKAVPPDDIEILPSVKALRTRIAREKLNQQIRKTNPAMPQAKRRQNPTSGVPNLVRGEESDEHRE